MFPRLCGSPSIPLSFILADVLPRWITYHFRLDTHVITRTSSDHRLQHGLPGYLILFAPHAFVPQRQYKNSKLPSLLVFFIISTHFTATLGIPISSASLKNASFRCSFWVEPRDYTTDLTFRLRALYA